MFGWKIKSSPSFTILEVIVYLFLLFAFTIATMRFFGDVQSFALLTNRETTRFLRTQLLFDVIFRDVVSASGDASEWDEKGFVFRKSVIDEKGEIKTVDVGFFLKNKRVIRYEGEYDFKKLLWITKSASTVGKDVSMICCSRWKYEVKVTVDGMCLYVRIRNCIC